MTALYLKVHKVNAKSHKIKLMYDRTYNSYDELYGEEQIKKYLIALRRVSVEGNILDAGCGTGLLLEFLKSQGLLNNIKKYVCLDISEGMLGVAYKRMERFCKSKCLGILADALHLPFKEKSFDFTLSFTVLDLLTDPLEGVREMLRVTRRALIVSSLIKVKKWTELLELGGKEIGRTDKDVIILFNV